MLPSNSEASLEVGGVMHIGIVSVERAKTREQGTISPERRRILENLV